MTAGVDDLYALPLDRFVAERDALAKGQEDRDEARRIKALRKPSLAAWTVNQLARSVPDEVRRLVELSDELRTARGESLRELSKERNQAVATLVERARSVLKEVGHPDTATTVERVTNTLQAASVDPDAADDLVSGRLTSDLQPSGFAPVPLAAVEDSPATDPAARRKARAELKKLEAAADRAEREAGEQERAAELAEEQARAARRAARTARRRADKARAKATQAAAP
jgi:hypothetical protein